MEQLIKVTRGGQVTIPAALRRAAGIEVGDYVEVQLVDERLVLTPKQVIDKSQAYFWTEAWQRGEREAEADLQIGRVERFETLEELFADLDAED
jgi:AbrB family looped-hinge helix DNA binding protein